MRVPTGVIVPAFTVALAGAPLWDVTEEDFLVDDDTMAARIGEAFAQGLHGDDARMYAGVARAPWNRHREPDYSGALGPYIV